MAAKVIRRGYTEQICSYTLDFEWEDRPGAGFSFTCDENGNVDVDKLQPEGKKSYLQCINGEFEGLYANGVRKYESSYRHRTVIECSDCNGEVYLYGFTNTCECGTDYNMSGQRLRSRQYWGEETGEHWSECI